MAITRAELFADVDRMDAHAWASHLARDVVLRFANARPIVGRDACEAMAARMFSRLESIAHAQLDQWQHGNATIIEASVTCRRLGRTEVTLPMVTIWREDHRHEIVDYRVYIDTSPLRD